MLEGCFTSSLFKQGKGTQNSKFLSPLVQGLNQPNTRWKDQNRHGLTQQLEQEIVVPTVLDNVCSGDIRSTNDFEGRSERQRSLDEIGLSSYGRKF